MILQELYKYYERKEELGEIAPLGWIRKEIDYLIEINEEGNFVDIKSLVEFDDRNQKFMGKSKVVPCIGKQALKHTNSRTDANFLWDNTSFVLGMYGKDAEPKTIAKKTLSLESFVNLIKGFNSQSNIKEISILLKFFNELQDESQKAIIIDSIIKKLTGNEIGRIENKITTLKEDIKDSTEKNMPKDELNEKKEILKKYTKELASKKKFIGGFLNGESVPAVTFRVYGSSKMIFELPKVKKAYDEYLLRNDNDVPKHRCLITGDFEVIEPKHLVIKGVYGGQTSGGAIVSFNKDSFCSYNKRGKLNGNNAPVGKKAANGYIQALNHLLHSKNRVSIVDTSIVFWANKESFLEQAFPLFLSKAKDDPDKNIRAVKQLYESIRSGKMNTETKGHFFVLGLAPNAARISVRYWITGTVVQFGQNIKQHFDDLEIVRSEKDSEFFALNTLLSNTALKYDLDNVAPNMAGQVTEAVLKGIPYPQTLLFSTVRRIRAEQRITRTRAAIIKACINRFNRFHNKNEKEITVSLDKKNMNPAYRLGRLFAVLEKIQKDALNIETIRERYYGAFSSTPVTVYPQLMKLKNHHLAKLEEGTIIYYERIIGEIIDGLDGSGLIPRQFSLEEQGRFAVGYYHQRQNFYKKKETNDDNETNEENGL